MTPSEDENYDAKVTDICDLYRDAPALVQSGERVMSTDELTGVQALERKHPGLPLAPGKVERREFEYIRHGTRSFIISRDVVTGQIVEPYGGHGYGEGRGATRACQSGIIARRPELRYLAMQCGGTLWEYIEFLRGAMVKAI